MDWYGIQRNTHGTHTSLGMENQENILTRTAGTIMVATAIVPVGSEPYAAHSVKQLYTATVMTGLVYISGIVFQLNVLSS
jgi:hypothetical protein